jgi:D-cysteine desulfhydrase
LPTPLVEAKNLTASLQGPRLLVKRDDLTGLAMGGNKTRACEFVLADARMSGCDVVLAVGPQHSNQLCAIAAAGKRCGMRVILLLLKGDDNVQGNLLLLRLLGAELRFTGVDISDIDEAHGLMRELGDALRDQGMRPYEIRYGALPLAGIVGYVLLMREILEALRETSDATLHIFVGSGSGLTQAGLVLGDRLMGGGCRIHGVMLDARYEQEEQETHVRALVQAGAALLGNDVCLQAGDVRCVPGYSGSDAATQQNALDVMRLAARTEGLFLDPVYTGRVMAAMIDQIRVGRISSQDTVIFYHSGGIPAVFSHCNAESF